MGVHVNVSLHHRIDSIIYWHILYLSIICFGYTVYIQELSDEMDVQVVPSSLFVSVPGQDKRIPYCRPAKHFLSLER